MSTESFDRPGDIRVVLADDHQVVRVGIRKILNRTPDIQVIGEARNGVEALTLANQLQPDILLLDIEMPGISGLAVARRLHEAGSQVRILVLSGYDDKEYIKALLEEDIAGYIVKGEAPDRIVSAIRDVASGHTGWFSARVARQMPEWQSTPKMSPSTS